MIPNLSDLFKCSPVSSLAGCKTPPVTKISTITFTNLGDFITKALSLVFMIAAFLAFFWLVWGAFEYIFAGGDKEKLAKARARIIAAIVGLILLALSFAITQWFATVLKPTGGTPISLIEPAYAASFPCGVSGAPACPVPVSIGTTYGFGKFNSLAEATNLLVKPAFSIATTAVVIYFLVGGFNLLTSSGDKEKVAGARNTITHAIIGFLILMFIFLILQFIPEFFGISFRVF